jgi:hypothetical protein
MLLHCIAKEEEGINILWKAQAIFAAGSRIAAAL